LVKGGRTGNQAIPPLAARLVVHAGGPPALRRPGLGYEWRATKKKISE
jgi:hypothetical protein